MSSVWTLPGVAAIPLRTSRCGLDIPSAYWELLDCRTEPIQTQLPSVGFLFEHWSNAFVTLSIAAGRAGRLTLRTSARGSVVWLVNAEMRMSPLPLDARASIPIVKKPAAQLPRAVFFFDGKCFSLLDKPSLRTRGKPLLEPTRCQVRG
jgi:hypothetical protein